MLKPLNETEPVRDVLRNADDRAVTRPPGQDVAAQSTDDASVHSRPRSHTHVHGEDTVEPTDGRKDACDCLHARCFPGE